MKDTILIVDDDSNMLEYVKHLLEESGYVVITAFNGTKAIQEIRQKNVSLIVTDMQMPPTEWGGLWLVNQVQKQALSIPIVILSERGTVSKAVEAMRMGAKNYVEKATMDEDLIPVIEETLLAKASINSMQQISVSVYFDSLQQTLGSAWFGLDEDERRFLANGEHIYHTHSHDVNFDFSAAVIEFAKAFEHAFNRIFIQAYKEWLRNGREQIPLIRLLNGRDARLTEITDSLTLGQLSFVCRQQITSEFCQNKGLTSIDNRLIETFLKDLRVKYKRNEAAHAHLIERHSFEILRATILGIGTKSPFQILFIIGGVSK